MILENLQSQDPRGTGRETISATRLQTPLSAKAPSDVQETQRVSAPAASHSPSKAHRDAQQRYLSAKTRVFCFQAKAQQSRTIQGSGRSHLQPTTSPRMTKHAPRCENVTSRHPCWSGTVMGHQKRGTANKTKDKKSEKQTRKDNPV